MYILKIKEDLELFSATLYRTYYSIIDRNRIEGGIVLSKDSIQGDWEIGFIGLGIEDCRITNKCQIKNIIKLFKKHPRKVIEMDLENLADMNNFKFKVLMKNFDKEE